MCNEHNNPFHDFGGNCYSAQGTFFYTSGVQLRVVDSVLELIGNTPMVRLGKIPGEGMADVFVKLEYMNPSGSLKDRIILQMIRDAEADGV